jgi:hypothetical protein
MKSKLGRGCDSAPIGEAPFSLTVFKTGSKDGDISEKTKNVQMLSLAI